MPPTPARLISINLASSRTCDTDNMIDNPRVRAKSGLPQTAGRSCDTLAQARRLAAPALPALAGLHLLGTVLRLAFLGTAAVAAGRLIMNGTADARIVLAVPALLAAAALVGLLADRRQADIEARIARKLRQRAGTRLERMPARLLLSMPVGSLVVSMQRHPEAIASLVIGHRISTSMMAIGPLVTAVAMALVSWQAALAVLALTPVMIVFFALVGEVIRKRADAQERAFGKLAGQFADRIRTLPTILANHAGAAEEAKLRGRLDTYCANTMGVLRIAFLNAGIIDFFTSLSIALLAVFLGLGHLKLATIPGFSGLELWQSLFVLVMAPDYFAPFRRFAEQYHAKAEGLAAAAALDRLLDQPLRAPDRPAPLPANLPQHGLVAVAGPSGSGKSTLLRRLAGIETGCPPLAGQLAGARIAWVSTDSFVPEGTLEQAIRWNTTETCSTQLMLAAGRVGLLDDDLLPGGLGAGIQRGGANLSGGQRMRIATARAMLTRRTVMADEPTAKLDAQSAEAVRLALREMATTRLVVVATHDRELIGQASLVIGLPASEHRQEAA